MLLANSGVAYAPPRKPAHLSLGILSGVRPIRCSSSSVYLKMQVTVRSAPEVLQGVAPQVRERKQWRPSKDDVDRWVLCANENGPPMAWTTNVVTVFVDVTLDTE